MKSRLQIFSILILAVIVVALQPAPLASFASPKLQLDRGIIAYPKESSTTQVLQSDDRGIIFELITSPFAISDGGKIEIAGLDEKSSDPGSPALPYFSTFIALPPGADLSIDVHELDPAKQGPLNILPVPQARLSGEAADENEILTYRAGSIHELTPEFVENKSIYNLDADFPGVAYSISEPLYMRDMRFVELKLFPLQYNPVSKIVSQASILKVDISFSDSYLENPKTVVAAANNQDTVWRSKIINYDEASSWRTLPQTTFDPAAIKLPTGVKTFKIELDQNGIYEVMGSDLAVKGMDLPVDPATIQMMQGSKQVAYQFIDTNNDQNFDANDKIRFYGWAFDGSRQEKMYVSDNVFWLWAGGEARYIPAVNNQAGSGTNVTSFRDSITEWKESYFHSAWSITWDVNDPTVWHTRRFQINPGITTSEYFDIDLPYPDPNAVDSTYLVELTTHLRRPDSGPSTTAFTAQTFLNDSTQFGEAAWGGPKNLNVINTVAGGVLKQPGDAGYPTNQVKVNLASNSATPIKMHVTRLTVDYTRQLVATADQLFFGREPEGPSSFEVSGFTNGDPDRVLAWDISNSRLPKQIKMKAGNITGSGADHTYLIGRDHAANASFYVTTSDNLLKIKSLSRYVPSSLDPPSGRAQWLAITHGSLRDAADTLAAYRHPHMSAHVVNIDDVANQIGYGFHTPETIRQYLRYAASEWTTAPEYVTLFGDATNNPRNLDCLDCGSLWDKDTPTLIVTDFEFVDRWQGMIPSDFSMSLLFGDDLIPDIAISRMPANTNQEASNMVQKVINYEKQRAEDVQQTWQKNILFVADNKDSAGNFCVQNADAGAMIPDDYDQTHLCLQPSNPDAPPTPADVIALRAKMRVQISSVGTSVMNYRGHGSTNKWAGNNGEPPILSLDDIDFWENLGRSVVILSADCLDGYFILNDKSALGETFLRLNNRGSVAHWSSAGLGYSSEHSILHKGFYEGLFGYKQIALGDAVNFAKIAYYQSGNHPSELYSFILLGDAAMTIVPEIKSNIYLPVTMAAQ